MPETNQILTKIEEYSLMFNDWDHIWEMSGPYEANFLAIYVIYLLVDA